jgi:hypothetical protein
MKTKDAAITRNYGFYLGLIPAIAIIAAWSFGLSAVIRKNFDPPIPQWFVVILVAAGIIGVLMLFARVVRTPTGRLLASIGVACLVVPLIATVFGGAYLWISDRLARNRQPLGTLILGVGLGITVFGFGMATAMEVLHMVLVFAGSVIGLIVVRLNSRPGPLSLMTFGALHFLTFFLAMAVASVEDQQRRTEAQRPTPTRNTPAEQDGGGQPSARPESR